RIVAACQTSDRQTNRADAVDILFPIKLTDICVGSADQFHQRSRVRRRVRGETLERPFEGAFCRCFVHLREMSFSARRAMQRQGEDDKGLDSQCLRRGDLINNNGTVVDQHGEVDGVLNASMQSFDVRPEQVTYFLVNARTQSRQLDTQSYASNICAR